MTLSQCPLLGRLPPPGRVDSLARRLNASGIIHPFLPLATSHLANSSFRGQPRQLDKELNA